MSASSIRPKWGWDASNWPDQRINWGSLSASQKAYAIREYNKARTNRGLGTIPNPWNNLHFPEKGPETITPRTPLKDLIRPSNFQRFPEGVKNRWLQYESSVKGQGTITGFLEQNPRDFPAVANSMADDTQLHDFIDTWLSNPKAQNRLNQILASAASGGHDIGAGPSGVEPPAKKPRTEPPVIKLEDSDPDQPDDIDSMPGAHEKHLSSPSGSDSSGSSAESMDTTSGGTPDPTVAATSGGIPGMSGGLNSTFGKNIYRPHSKYSKQDHTMTFNKVHMWASAGCAEVPITNTTTDPRAVYCTSSLAEIPWERPFMYMSPGEFAALPKGAYAKSCHVRIKQHNPRVAFETGSAATGLATFNQNKFGVSAVGINMMKPGRNYSYTYASGNPMRPETIKTPDYFLIANNMYGSNQTSTTFNTAEVGTTNLSSIMHPNVYYCFSNLSRECYADTVWNSTNALGWDNLFNTTTIWNMAATIDTYIIDQSYSFGHAPLTEPIQSHGKYISNQHQYHGAHSHTYHLHDKLPLADPTVTSVNITAINKSKEGWRTLEYVDMMESSQVHTVCHDEGGVKDQPSVHVGIKPIPKLTTNLAQLVPSSWTDVQAIWEIECSLIIGFSTPHYYAYGPNNIHPNSAVMIYDNAYELNVTSNPGDMNRGLHNLISATAAEKDAKNPPRRSARLMREYLQGKRKLTKHEIENVFAMQLRSHDK